MSGFHHSIKVPTQYKRVASILKTALGNQKLSLKTLIYKEKHARIGSMQAVLSKYIENRGAIDAAIEETKILEDNPRLNPELCKILVTDLIFGAKALNGESKPVQTVLEYKDRLTEALGGLQQANSSDIKEKEKDQKPRYVRVNTNLLSLENADRKLAKDNLKKKEYSPFESYDDFLKAIEDLARNEYMVDMHVDNLLIFHQKQKKFLALHEYTLEKKFLLQDKGTCLVAELLRPPAGSTVLDMCAAPGMKTIHTCNILRNEGTIYAVERDHDRYNVLCQMIISAGCKIVKPIKDDVLNVTAEQCPDVEYILVDPSCTGSGMPNRLSLQPEEKCPERINNLAGLQIKMLSHAMSAFPDVKRIAYSTCSIYEEENEQVVQKCLKLNPNFKILSGKKFLRNKWRSVGSSDYEMIGKNCIYSRPEDDFSDGIFIAIFEKIDNPKN